MGFDRAVTALDSVQAMLATSLEERQRMRVAIEKDGHFYWLGRKILLTYEDTGQPTNVDQSPAIGP